LRQSKINNDVHIDNLQIRYSTYIVQNVGNTFKHLIGDRFQVITKQKTNVKVYQYAYKSILKNRTIYQCMKLLDIKQTLHGQFIKQWIQIQI